MTTRKSRAPKASSDTVTVTVTVVEPHLVFHDGDQRSGTIDDVSAEVASHWAKHGWVTITPTVDTATNKTSTTG
jgi:hypothetical protein